MGIRVGVAGVGHLGREHVRVLCGLEGVDEVACYDSVSARAEGAATTFGARAFPTLEKMIEVVDAVAVVVPTIHHAEISLAALRAGKDVFVEKPIANSVADGERMIRCARENQRLLQVGHVERFNGVMQAVVSKLGRAQFVEVHRLAPFTIRGTDVSVVGDLMIHDLDLLGYILGEWPSEIRASGASILTEAPDIVNARLEYPSGCVANVTASRVTMTPMRKVRVFSNDGYTSIDLLKQTATCYRKSSSYGEEIAKLRAGAGDGGSINLANFIEMETITADRGEPLARELGAFRDAVITRAAPPVTGEDGLKAIKLATEILSCMDNHDSA